MTQNEINGLVEQYLSQNKVKLIPQSYLKKHNIPTFGQRQKVRGGMCGPILLNENLNSYYKGKS